MVNIVPDTTGGHQPSARSVRHSFASVTPGSATTIPVALSHDRMRSIFEKSSRS